MYRFLNVFIINLDLVIFEKCILFSILLEYLEYFQVRFSTFSNLISISPAEEHLPLSR